jgi:hypothetical protein
MSGELDVAISLLESLVQRVPFELMPQCVRFYLLVSLGELEGAVTVLNDLFNMGPGSKPISIDSIVTFMELVEELAEYYLEMGLSDERALIINPLLQMMNKK